ncbi:MAG: ribosome-associated translation inhibitor RaiA [Patescibacteria group bacterium]|nr:ribosome-associated translation inhibitor RaiA [Patescibacteria group bacterium]
MKIDITANSLDLTPALKEYINMKLQGVDKFLGKLGEGTDVYVRVEVGRITRHHHKGDVFSAKAVLRAAGTDIRAGADGEDARAVVDEVKDKLIEEVRKFKEKREEK